MPDGRWAGTITLERLAHLKARWDRTQAAWPDVFTRLQAGRFEEEVAGMLLDWEARTRKLSARKLAQQCDSAPAPLVEALLAAAGVLAELFASPLDVHPSTPAYLSVRERDQLFGAGWDAYRHRWTGVGFAHPPETKEEVQRAVRWALASAQEAARDWRPVLTFMLLPNWPTEGHAQYLGFPEAALLAKLPGTMFKTAALRWTGNGCQWSHRGAAFPRRGDPGYVLVVVGNPAGRQWLAQQQLGGLAEWRELPNSLGMSSRPVPWPWRLAAPEEARRHPTPAGGGARRLEYDWAQFADAYTAQLLDWQGRASAAPLGCKPPRKLLASPLCTHALAANWHAPAPALREELAAAYAVSCQPRYEWGDALYTDGSVQDREGRGQCVGAGVYSAKANAAYRIRVNGSGPDDTITRAELAGLEYAVCHLLGDSESPIFTDSMAAVCLLRKALRNP